MEMIDKYEINFENTKIPILIYKNENDFVGTYEVGIFLGGRMIDSSFTVTKQEYDMIFPLDPDDCKRMGWGEE